jgi:hypothetical protein
VTPLILTDLRYATGEPVTCTRAEIHADLGPVDPRGICLRETLVLTLRLFDPDNVAVATLGTATTLHATVAPYNVRLDLDGTKPALTDGVLDWPDDTYTVARIATVPLPGFTAHLRP